MKIYLTSLGIRQIKFKPQWAITTLLLEQLKLKIRITSNAGEDAEKTRLLIHCW